MYESREQKLERELRNEQHSNMQDQVNKIEKYVISIDERVKETNGKIKKITLALVLAFGLILGLVSTNLQGALSILI